VELTFARNSDYNAFFRMETHLPFSLLLNTSATVGTTLRCRRNSRQFEAGVTLDVVDSGRYLGVTINKDPTWTKHINQTIVKASKTLGFLRRNLGRCTTKTTAYTTLV
jgi:hypothetical protein